MFDTLTTTTAAAIKGACWRNS